MSRPESRTRARHIVAIATIASATISLAGCVQWRADVAPDAPDAPYSRTVFAARSETTDLAPLPSRGCRLKPEDRTQPALGAVQRRLSSGGHVRHFLLSLPPTDDTMAQREGLERAPASAKTNAPMPLVLNLHGLLETSEEQQILSGMEPLALARGWAIAWPEGVGYSWNGGACCGRATDEPAVDDVQFFRELVAQLGRELCLDLRRVYATGMSNGGFMSYRLACDASDLFAAVAPGAAVEGAESCTPVRPVPILAFNGTSDLLVPFDGRKYAKFPSAAESLAGWRARNKCTGPDRKLFANGDATCTATTACAGDGEVILCSVEGGGHTWPGGMVAPYLGHTSSSIDASATILDFFAAHARP